MKAKIKSESRVFAYKNGKYIALNKITMPANNLAIERAYAVYEFFRVNNGKAFYLDRHLKRFYNSLEFLNIRINHAISEIEEVVNQLIVKNSLTDFFIKIYAVPEHYPDKNKLAGLYILPTEMPVFAQEIYRSGTALLMKDYLRFLPEAKSTNYIASVFWHSEMNSIKAIDILFVHNNQALECSRGNIFIVKSGMINTPDAKILKGITRSIVLDIIEERKMPYSLKSISTDELFAADEIFITSTTKKIMPIVRIGNQVIGKGIPGAVTLKISEDYNAFLS